MANKYFRHKGLWKIPNQYVEYIQNKYPQAQSKYNLVTEKQFNLHMFLDNELTSPSEKLSNLEMLSLLSDEIKDDALKASQDKTPEVAEMRAKMIQGVLKKDRLNVVGENHDESGNIRKEERIYAAIFSGSSKYWEEDKFRVRAKEKSEKGQPKNYDKRPFADPFALKFFQAIWFVYNAAKNIDKSQIQGECLRSNMDNFYLGFGTTSALSRKLEDLSAGKQGFELESEEKEKFWELSSHIEEMAITWQDAYENYYQTIPNQQERNKYPKPDDTKQKYIWWATTGQKVVTSNNEPIENCIASVNNLVKAVEQKGLLRKWNLREDSFKGNPFEIKTLSGTEMSDDEIAILRSVQMHEVANQRHDDRGVWKIGKEHVAHIRARYPESERQYNLVDKDSFDAALKFGLYFAYALALGKPEYIETLKHEKFWGKKELY